MGNFISKLKNWAIRAGLQFPKDRRWNFFFQMAHWAKTWKKCNLKRLFRWLQDKYLKDQNQNFLKFIYLFSIGSDPSSGRRLHLGCSAQISITLSLWGKCFKIAIFCCFIALCGWEATTRWCVPLNYWNQFFYYTPCEEREEEEGSVRRCLCFSIIINV